MKEYCGLICVEEKGGNSTTKYFECNAKSERHARGVLLCGALYHYPNTTVSTEYVSRIKGGKPVKHTDFKALRDCISQGIHKITRDMTIGRKGKLPIALGVNQHKEKPAAKTGQLIPFSSVVKKAAEKPAPKATPVSNVRSYVSIFSPELLKQTAEEGTYQERD